MKIGIIGGSGALATNYLVSKILDNAILNGANEDKDFPNMVILNNNSINIDYLGYGDNESFLKIKEEVSSLINMQCNVICFACNSIQIYIKELSLTFPNIIFINSFELIEIDNKEKIGILSSNFTKDNFNFNNSIFLSVEEQNILNRIIKDTIGFKNVANNKNILNELISSLIEKGCSKIIICCSELSIIKPDLPVLIDTMDLLAQKIINITRNNNESI